MGRTRQSVNSPKVPSVPVRAKSNSETPKSTRGRPRDPNLVQQRKEQILKVTTHHFARFGYQDADLQVIADELEIGKGTIYRYFPTKEALFRAALDRGLASLRDLIDQKIPPDPTHWLDSQAPSRPISDFFVNNRNWSSFSSLNGLYFLVGRSPPISFSVNRIVGGGMRSFAIWFVRAGYGPEIRTVY